MEPKGHNLKCTLDNEEKKKVSEVSDFFFKCCWRGPNKKKLGTLN